MNVAVYNFVPYRIIAIAMLKDQILSDSAIWDYLMMAKCTKSSQSEFLNPNIGHFEVLLL